MKRFILVLVCLAFCLFSYAKTSPYDVTSGPWVTNVTDSTFTVLWTTSQSGLSFVEYIEGPLRGTWYKAEKKRVYQTVAGRRYPSFLHSVTIKHLKPGTNYQFRIGGQALISQLDPYEYTYGFERFSSRDYNVTTFNSSAPSCSFAAVNDMHLQTDKYSSLIQTESVGSKDFILLNGDIVTAGDYSLDSLIYYNISPLGTLTRSKPIMFVKGNHEGRGNVYTSVSKLFPTSSGQYYYIFRQGPVAFLVLDAGETGAEPATSFSGSPAYIDYLQEQLEWAEKAVLDPSFSSAPVKVCLIHVPIIPKSNTVNYTTEVWMGEHFTPFLNRIGIDLMISAHKHVFSIKQPGEFGNDFPIFINGNSDRLEFDADEHGIKVRTYDVSGAETHSLDLSL